MEPPESAVGAESAFSWDAYSVSRRSKEPLLRFLVEALELRGCSILHVSEANRAPFYLVLETPGGERHGVLAYAFFANSKPTKNRPLDEHRFQIKYGGELKGVLNVSIDPTRLVTTLFLGIDVEREVFIAADPLMNSPSPMSRSIEFKLENVEAIQRSGWAAWERERHAPRTTTRPTPDITEDTRVQVLVGGTKEHLFDLIQLERIAHGLDLGDRHLVADTLLERPASIPQRESSHDLLKELNIPSEALFDLINGASRLKMAVRGWVAETHLEKFLRKLPEASDCHRIEGEGQPDITLRWKGGPPILIECKNVLRKRNAAGLARVDFQRTRASKDRCSRYYLPTEFAVLAACLHAVTEEWKFSFALTKELPHHATCEGRITNNILVAPGLFTDAPELVFDKCSH